MSRNKSDYGFIFSTEVKDWMSSSETREKNRERYRNDHRRRKEEKSSKVNTGRQHIQMMNDQIRA
jgi:hypothetical protein